MADMNIAYLVSSISYASGEFIIRYHNLDGSDQIEAFYTYPVALARWEELYWLIESGR